MPTTSGNDYVGSVGPNGIQVWRPTVTSPTSIQGSSRPAANTGTTSPVSDGGQGTSKDQDGNVYASALFFVASCRGTDDVGDTVRADAAINSVTAVNCYQPYPAIGVVVKKLSPTRCVVQTYGICQGIYSSLTANDRYFVGPDGTPTLASAMPQDAVYVQAMGFAVQSGALFIMPTGTFVRRYSSGSTGTPAPGQQGDAPAPGDTVQAQGGRILHGQGAPAASYGDEGDTYLQTDAPGGYLLWGPKPTASDWQNTYVSLQGQPGNRIYVGYGPPAGSIMPQQNDLYLDQTSDSPQLYVAS